MKTCTKCKIEKPKTDFSKNASRRDGHTSQCRSCANESRRDNWAENSDKISEIRRKQYANNPHKKLAYNRKYYCENKDKVAQRRSVYFKEYYAAKKSLIDEKNRIWAQNNMGKIREAEKARREANPDRYKANNCAHQHRRRARIYNAEGSHSAADVRTIFEKQQGLCANCETKLFKSGAKKYHVDHIMPLKLGGSNWPANLQCLCPTCNLKKNAKDPVKWANENGRLI